MGLFNLAVWPPMQPDTCQCSPFFCHLNKDSAWQAPLCIFLASLQDIKPDTEKYHNDLWRPLFWQAVKEDTVIQLHAPTFIKLNYMCLHARYLKSPYTWWRHTLFRRPHMTLVIWYALRNLVCLSFTGLEGLWCPTGPMSYPQGARWWWHKNLGENHNILDQESEPKQDTVGYFKWLSKPDKEKFLKT